MKRITIIGLFVFIYVYVINGYTYDGEPPQPPPGEEDDMFGENLPGFETQSLTIMVPARKEECFFEYLKVDNTLFVSFQEMKGGQTTMYIRSPLGGIVDRHTPTAYATSNIEIKEAGTYQICFANFHARVGTSHVYTFIGIYDEEKSRMRLQKQLDERDTELAMMGLSRVFSSLQKNLILSRQHLTSQHKHLYSDFLISMSNNRYIQWWSVMQCSAMVAIGCGQVFVIRRMFRERLDTANPRC